MSVNVLLTSFFPLSLLVEFYNKYHASQSFTKDVQTRTSDEC